MRVCVHACVCVCMNACMYMGVYVCMRICMHVYMALQSDCYTGVSFSLGSTANYWLICTNMLFSVIEK